MRTFLALPISFTSKFEADYLRVKEKLDQEKIRWVDPSQLHLTLFFLGETTENQVSIIAEMIKEKLALFSSFELKLKGLGVFGASEKPTVLWTGVKPCDELLELQKIVAELIVSLGFTAERRAYIPHITLGRIRAISGKDMLRTLISDEQDSFTESMPMNRVVLYKSELTSSGAVYIPLSECLLVSAE